jgi:adenylate cyclase
VTVSRQVFDQVKRTASLAFESLGPRALKNISEPVELFRVVDDQPAHGGLLSMPGAGVRTTPVRGEKPALAVLPFVNMRGDPEQDYSADGFPRI